MRRAYIIKFNIKVQPLRHKGEIEFKFFIKKTCLRADTHGQRRIYC